MIIEKGMTMAVDTLESAPGVRSKKLEEMIFVGNNGVEIMTKMPVKDMMIVHPIITT
jgi:Xaa-Pro aminopeptidase